MSKKTRDEIKSLEDKNDTIKVDINTINSKVTVLVDEKAVLNRQLINNNDELLRLYESMKPKAVVTPEITDHALVRFLERVKGFDLQAFRDEILTPERIAAINSGVVGFKCDGYQFKVENNKIVTIY